MTNNAERDSKRRAALRTVFVLALIALIIYSGFIGLSIIRGSSGG